jgi:hypothetical protein
VTSSWDVSKNVESRRLYASIRKGFGLFVQYNKANGKWEVISASLYKYYKPAQAIISSTARIGLRFHSDRLLIWFDPRYQTQNYSNRRYKNRTTREHPHFHSCIPANFAPLICQSATVNAPKSISPNRSMERQPSQLGHKSLARRHL